MTDNVENLIVEQFRAQRDQIEAVRGEMREEFRDVKHRLNRVETAVAGIRRNEADTAEDVAHQQARIDQLVERIQRIEHRLDLVDT